MRNGAAFLVLYFLAPPAIAQSPLPSLFGFTLSEEMKSRQDFILSSQDRDYIIVSRMSKNKEYLLQTLKLTKKTQTIASIGASSSHVPDGECDAKLAALLAQLKRANPDYRQQITDTGRLVRYELSRRREGCSYDLPGIVSNVPCVSYFAAYCSRDGQGRSTLFMEAGDTGLSELARREAEQAGLSGPSLIK